MPASSSPAPPPPEEPSDWHKGFAFGIGVLILGLTGAALWYPATSAWSIGVEEWSGKDGNRLLAASLSLPLTVIGGLTIGAGVWMAIVEWRGRFKSSGTVSTKIEPGPVIDALGKLRGAALLLVVGGILMIGSAWIAQSAAKPTVPASGTSSSEDPAGTNS